MTTAEGRVWFGTRVLPFRAGSASAAATADMPRWVVGVAFLVPSVLPVAWAIAAPLQPPAYSPMRQTVSQLSGYAATDRWIVTGALYIVGVAYVLAARGMAAASMPARTGLALSGIAALGVASFPEPVHGTNSAHAAFTALGAVTLTAWPVITAAQRNIVAAVGRMRSIAAIVVSIGLFAWTAIETRDGSALGLAERLSGLQACWPLVVALALRRDLARAPQSRKPAIATY